MAVLYKFGDYAYPGSVIQRGPLAVGARLRTGDTPNRAGAYTEGGLLAARRLTVAGVLQWSAGDGQAEIDALFAAHVPGLPKKLYYGRDDRYLIAETDGTGDTGSEDLIGAMKWEINFLCSNPYFYAETATTVTLSTTGGTVTTLGTVSALPVLHYTLSAAAANATVQITNTTTGQSIIVAASTAGAYTLDSEAQSIMLGTSALDAALLSGDFLELKPGANTLVIAASAGATVQSGSANVVFRDNWV